MADVTPEEGAKKIRDASGRFVSRQKLLMHRMVLVVERHAKRRTPVRTGHLRRSVTSRVHAGGESGEIGTNLSYARFVHEGTKFMAGRPFLRNALEDSRMEIGRILDDEGASMVSEVGT